MAPFLSCLRVIVSLCRSYSASMASELSLFSLGSLLEAWFQNFPLFYLEVKIKHKRNRKINKNALVFVFYLLYPDEFHT